MAQRASLRDGLAAVDGTSRPGVSGAGAVAV